jgi:hypothetical protein
MPTPPWRHIGAVSVVFACLLALTAGNAAAATTSKPYSVTFSPATIPAGATKTVTATVTNQASPQSIGSIDFAPPAGLTVTGTRRFLSVAIAPGTSRDFTFSVTAPCAARAAAAWTVTAKQSNDFSGPPGNDFGPATGSLTTAVTGSCSLVWTSQPLGAVVDQAVSAVAFHSQAPWPAVSLLDGEGGPLPGRTITVRLGLSAGLATMPDRLPVTGADGAAQLTGAAAAALGSPGVYRFSATFGSLTAVSMSFPVQTTVLYCPPDCNSSQTGDLASVDIAADPSTTIPNGYVTSSIFQPASGLATPSCTGYTSISSRWSTVIVSAGRSKSVVYRIDRRDMNRAPQNGAAGIHVCYGEPAPSAGAYTAFNPADPATWWWGSGVQPGTQPIRWDSDGDGVADGALWVLASCKASGGVRPCEDKTFKNGSGDGIAQFLLAAGAADPMGRP